MLHKWDYINHVIILIWIKFGFYFNIGLEVVVNCDENTDNATG